MKIAVYDLKTGLFTRFGIVPAADKDAQHGDGEGVLTGVDVNPQTQRMDVSQDPPALVDIVTPPPTLDEVKAAAKQKVAQRRWEVETGGVTLNGVTIDTDDRSKLLLSSAAEQARDDATFTANWKTAGGTWAQLDAPTILAVYSAVFAHVRACFAREAELCGMIDRAASTDDVAWLDASITAFWPAA